MTKHEDGSYVPFARPDLREEEIANVVDVLRSGWITTGSRTQKFEERFAKAVGAEHAVAVNSCTAAMHLALEAIGLEAGDEVITSPYSFAATAEVIRYFDAIPIFVDVEPATLNIRTDQIEEAITERTKAVIPVHIAGRPAELDRIYTIAREHEIRVVEDAAHAFPAEYQGRTIGGAGDITCFSFYATKTITTGEGGMLCTSDETVAERARIMALHGISKDAWKRYSSEGSWYYEILAPGFKYNMTDIAAAMGIAQLTRAEEMHRRREEIAAKYTQAFENREELQVPTGLANGVHAWHLYMLRLELEQLSVSRAEFVEAMEARGIGTSVHFIPLHIHPYYRETFDFEPNDYPIAYREYQREVSLPIYSGMSDSDVEQVIDSVISVVEEYPAVEK